MSAVWPALASRGYRLALVSINDVSGLVTPVHEFSEFLVPQVRDVLNDIGSMSFTLRVHDPGVQYIAVAPSPPNRTEIQLWRRDRCIFWGVVVALSAGAVTVTYEARSLEQYLRWRRPGPAAQTELINNPSFEDSAYLAFPAGWSDFTGGGNAYTDFSSPVFPSLIGTKDVLTTGGAAADRYIEQVLTVAAPATAAMRFEVSAWYKSDPGPSPAIGDTFQDRGLFVTRLTYPGAVVIDSINAPLDQLANDAQWRRLSVESNVPNGETYYISIRLYLGFGVVSYDGTAFRRKYATYTYGEDRVELAHRLVDQAANGGIATFSQGGGPNGDLQSEITHPPVHIRWDPANPTDIDPDDLPAYIDHDTSADFLTLLQDFPRLGFADFSIDISTGTERYFRVHAPTRGNYRPDQTLEVGRNIVRISYGVSSANVADQLLPNGLDWSNTLPNPLGTDRDIWAQVSPTPESTLQQIEDFIPQEVVRRSRPSPLSSVTVSASSEAGSILGIGDTVPIRATLGLLPPADGTYRILASSLDPASDLVTYEVVLT